MPDEMLDLQGILGALDSAQVRYVLIGGLAMVAHGSAHVTQDIDITFARDAENLALLAEALATLNPQLRGAPPGLPFVFDVHTLKNSANLTLDTSLGAIDVLGEVPGVASFEALWEHSQTIHVYGYCVHIASLDDLIQMKRAANRPKDRLHLLELEALHRLKSADG